MVYFNFTRKPSAKNLNNRSVSFQNNEVEIIGDEDVVRITVLMPKGGSITIEDGGLNFKQKLVQKSKDNAKFQVYSF